MATRKITDDDIRVLRAYADGNMNCINAAKLAHYGKDAIYDHLDKIHILTGKNPRNFWELLELLEMYKERKID